MSEKQTLQPFSVNRLHVLWNLLCLATGIAVSIWLHSSTTNPTGSDWRTFSGVLAAVSATIAGFLAAVAALLYAIEGTPLVRQLQSTGHVQRILFDLFCGVALWLFCLTFGLLGCLPGFEEPAPIAMASLAFALAGILTFIPLGHSFWLLLSNAHAPMSQPKTHDWNASTTLD